MSVLTFRSVMLVEAPATITGPRWVAVGADRKSAFRVGQVLPGIVIRIRGHPAEFHSGGISTEVEKHLPQITHLGGPVDPRVDQDERAVSLGEIRGNVAEPGRKIRRRLKVQDRGEFFPNPLEPFDARGEFGVVPARSASCCVLHTTV